MENKEILDPLLSRQDSASPEKLQTENNYEQTSIFIYF